MSTIQLPHRPPGYLARQGYVKPLWHVKLRRSDVTPHRTYVPDEEAYNLPALSEKLESDKYSISTIDHVTVELTRSGELVGFLKGLKDPKFLRVKISSYLLFRKHQKQLVWFGLLQNLPEGVDAYPWDKLKLTFVSPPGAWEDGDEVKDSETDSAYRNKHVTDVLLPAFLEKASKQSGGGTRREGELEAPLVRGDDYFWSGLDRPKKKLARSEAEYDDTCKVTAMCWDSQKNLLYLGVHDPPGSKKLPWLISYDPSKREWVRLAKFKYGGGKEFLKPRENTEWEVEYLDYANQKLYFVCRTNHHNLSENRAHYKCKGEIDLTNPIPRIIYLTDENLFTLNDRGVVVHSKCVAFDNRDSGGGPRSHDSTDYYADIITECIGWGTPQRGVKECGVPMISGRASSKLYADFDAPRKTFLMPKGSVRPGRNHYVEIEMPYSGRRQSLGMVQNVDDKHSDYYIVTVANAAGRDYPVYEEVLIGEFKFKFYTHVYFQPLCDIPKDNVFISEPQTVGVEFVTSVDYYDPETVYVESRLWPSGREQFYWPRNVAEVSETEDLFIDDVGYVSFICVRDLNEYDSGTSFVKYSSGPVPMFKVSLKGYNRAYLLADKLWVRNRLQEQVQYRPGMDQPGKCQLVYDKKVCTYGNGTRIETYGDIFLWKDGSKVYAAWNDFEKDGNGEQYAVCRVAEHSGNGKFTKLWQNREGQGLYDKPECYITSFAFFKNKFYFGCRYYERNWIATGMKIFWAAPPQNEYLLNMPTGYDGTYAVICMVKGDKSDVIQEGDMVNLGAGKRYRVSEVETLEREVGKEGKPYLAPGEEIYRGKVTSFLLLSLDEFRGGEKAYEGQVCSEVLGKKISISKGRVERHQIKELADWGSRAGDWKTIYTAEAGAGEPAEGKQVEYDAQQWKGETHTIGYDDDYRRMPRVKLKHTNVKAGSITVTLKGSAREIKVHDETSKAAVLWLYSLRIPATYEAYAHRKQGDDYDSCYIYFNAILEGEEIDVRYTYDVSDAAIKSPVVFKGDLYFNETGDRHRFLKRVYDEKEKKWKFEETYSPRVGDRELACIAAGDDRIWAVSAPSYLLVQFAREWSGYVHEVDGAGKKIWNVVADLARAGDQYCFDRLGTLYVVNRATPTRTGTFPHILQITRKDLPPYERVVFSYANGKVAQGTGKPELSLSCNYVYDKGHADVLCQKAYEYYAVRRREYHVECAGVLEQIGLGEEKEFEYLGKQASGIIVGRQFSPQGATTFTVVERVGQGESAGGGQGAAQEA